MLEALASIAHNHYYETPNAVSELDGLLARLALQAEDFLLIAGGDGTISLVLGALLRQLELANRVPCGDSDQSTAEKIPLIALVPLGSTNLTALDLHGKTNARMTVFRLKTMLKYTRNQWPIVRRPLMKLSTEGQIDRYGFVFGLGIFADGVRYFNDKLRGRGLGQELAAALAAARMLLGLCFSPRRLGGVDLTMATNGGQARTTSLSLLMTSTLDRTLFRLHYHWGEDDGGFEHPIHYLGFSEQPPRLMRAMVAILFNQKPPWLLHSDHYQSASVIQLDLGFRGAYVLDGECYQAADNPIHMTADYRIPLLKLTDRPLGP